jgi:hypothetical protein
MKKAAKAIYNWRALPRQLVKDYRYHSKMQGLPAPLIQRRLEQVKLLWNNRITAQDYYKFGLFDPAMPLAKKRSYIGEFQPWKILSLINTSTFHALTDDKLRFHAHALKAGLPIAELLATTALRDKGHALPNLDTQEALRAWMNGNEIADIILKPVNGMMGRGLLSLGDRLGEDRWLSLPTGEAVDSAQIWAHCQEASRGVGMIVQRRMVPHPRLARIVPNVLCTVRVITYLDPAPTIVDAALRLGSGKKPADNMHAGGIPVPVNLATGECGGGNMIMGGLPHEIEDHPLTGERIKGFVLPDWQLLLDLAQKAARSFSNQRSLGWDIGLTQAGPVILEANWCYDLGLQQMARRKGVLETPWATVFDGAGAYQNLSLGFSNRQPPRVSSNHL